MEYMVYWSKFYLRVIFLICVVGNVFLGFFCDEQHDRLLEQLQ